MNNSEDAYEQHAREFLRRRDKSTIGSRIVEQWCRTLPERATGVELACGGGYPITRTLDNAGFRLWAVDGSPTLVATFQSRFPHIPVQCARVQDFDYFNRSFDFAISIGLIFLLAELDQVKLISRISKILVPGGRYLLTAPNEVGNWIDENTGLECKSLGRSKYEEIFDNAGFGVVTTYMDVGENNYFDLQGIV